MGQSRMNSPETLATLGTQDTGKDKTKHTTQKTKKMSNKSPIKNRGWKHVVAKGKQFLPFTRHL